MFATALGLLGALGLSACKLETSGLCNFSKNACIFQDNTARSSELGIPIDSFVNRPLNSNSGNEDCRIPQANETFYMLIEPCWSNGTATPADMAECPDVPVEYYQENAIPVLSHDSRLDDSIGLVSGRPTELNILNIGANYLFEGRDEDSGQTTKAPFDSVTRLDKFQFRTIPINDNSWKALLSQVNSKVLMMARVTTKFESDKMSLDPLTEFYTDASETMPLRPEVTGEFTTYSKPKKPSDFDPEEWVYKRKRTLQYCMGSFYRNMKEMNSFQGYQNSADAQNRSVTSYPNPGPKGWNSYSGISPNPYTQNQYQNMGIMVALPGVRQPMESSYQTDAAVRRLTPTKSSEFVDCQNSPPCDNPGFGPDATSTDEDTYYNAKSTDNFVYPYMSIVGCQEELMYTAPFMTNETEPVPNVTSPTYNHISEYMSLFPSANASFEMWVDSGFNDVWGMIKDANYDGVTRETAKNAAATKAKVARYWPGGGSVSPPRWNNAASNVYEFMRTDPSVPKRADLAALQSTSASFHSGISNGAFWCAKGTVFCSGVPDQSVFTNAYNILGNFMDRTEDWAGFGRDSVGKLAGCTFKTNKFRGISTHDLYSSGKSSSNGTTVDEGEPTVFQDGKVSVPEGTFNFKQPKTRTGEYPSNLNEKGLVESNIRIPDVNEFSRAQEIRLMRYNVSVVNKMQSQYLGNMRGCLDYLEREDVQKHLINESKMDWMFSSYLPVVPWEKTICAQNQTTRAQLNPCLNWTIGENRTTEHMQAKNCTLSDVLDLFEDYGIYNWPHGNNSLNTVLYNFSMDFTTDNNWSQPQAIMGFTQYSEPQIIYLNNYTGDQGHIFCDFVEKNYEAVSMYTVRSSSGRLHGLDDVLYRFMQYLGPYGNMKNGVPENKLERHLVENPRLLAFANNQSNWTFGDIVNPAQDMTGPIVLNSLEDRLVEYENPLITVREDVFDEMNREKYVDDFNSSTLTGLFGPPASMDTDRFVKNFCKLPDEDDTEGAKVLQNLKVCYTPDIFTHMAARDPKPEDVLSAYRTWANLAHLKRIGQPHIIGNIYGKNWMRNIMKLYYFSNLAMSYCYLGLEARKWGSRAWQHGMNSGDSYANGMDIKDDPWHYPVTQADEPADSLHNDLFNPIAHTYVPREMLHVYRLPMLSGQEEQYDTTKDDKPTVLELQMKWDLEYISTLEALKSRYCFPFWASFFTPNCGSEAAADAMRITLSELGRPGSDGAFTDGCRMATYTSDTSAMNQTIVELLEDIEKTINVRHDDLQNIAGINYDIFWMGIPQEVKDCMSTPDRAPTENPAPYPKCAPFSGGSGDAINTETWWQMTTANTSNRVSPFLFTSGDATGSEPRWAEGFHGPRFTKLRYVYQSLSESMRVQNGIDWLSSKIEGTSVYAQQTANGCLFTEDDIGNDDLADIFRHAALARGDAANMLMNRTPESDKDNFRAMYPLPYEEHSELPIGGKNTNFNTNFIQNKMWCLFYQDEINARSYPAISNGRGTARDTAAYKAGNQRTGADTLFPTPFRAERTPVIKDYCRFERYTEGVGDTLKVFYRKRDQNSCGDAVTRARWSEQKAGTYTETPRCLWYQGSQNDFLKKITAKTQVIKAEHLDDDNTVSYKRQGSPDELEYGTCEGGGEMYALDAKTGKPQKCTPKAFLPVPHLQNPQPYSGAISQCEEDNLHIAMTGALCGYSFAQNATRRKCNVMNEGQPRNPEKSALFDGRCVPNPDADWDNWDSAEFPPHVNAFVGEGATARYTSDSEEPEIVTSDLMADNECKDQCMIYATANIVTNHYRTIDNSTQQWMKKIQEENNDIEDELYFSGFGLVGRMRNSAIGTATSPLNQSKGVAMSENVYENLISRGYFGAFAPWQELTCPMEITIGDDRTESMSPKQQFDNIYVSAVEMVGDIPVTTESLGRGCYMCTKAKENIYDTLKNEDIWTRHYDEEACSVESILPSMEGVPYFTGYIDPLGASSPDYVNTKYEGTDDQANIYDQMRWRDDTFYQKADGTDKTWSGTPKNTNGFCPIEEPGKPQPTLNDFNFDSMKRFRPFRNLEHFQSIGGIYTLYPYVKVPSLAKDADPTKQVRWESLITQQLDYMYNPAWHVTVEVVGLSKAKGRPVLRNFHGRMLEENLVDFDVEKYAHQDPINLYKVEGFDTFTRGLETTPAMCLTSFFNSQSGNKDDVQIKEYDCISDLDTTETTIKGSKQYEYSIDFDNIVEGQAKWMQTLLSDVDPILRLIMTDRLSASEDAVDNPAIPFDDRFFVVQRNDGDCEAQLGEVEVEFHMGLMCSDIASDVAVDMIMDAAVGAALALLLGPESAPILAAEIGVLVGEVQALAEAGIFNPSSFYHHKTHKERFSSCKPKFVAGNWTNGVSGSRYVKAAFEAMRKRITLNNDIMCIDGDWLHDKQCDACFALPEAADRNDVNFSYNFDWFDMLVNGDQDQCSSEDTYGNNPSERSQCGTYSYEVQIGPLDLGFNKYKRKGESRARFGLMGPPDDMFGLQTMCGKLSDRYCNSGVFSGTSMPGACTNGDLSSGDCADASDPDNCVDDFMRICNAQSNEQRLRMFQDYQPSVKVTRMDKPCIFEQPATFFTTYSPASYFGYIGTANWSMGTDGKPDPAQMNLDNPFAAGPNARQIQFKNIFGQSDDRCLNIPTSTGISDTAEDLGVGCGMDQSTLNTICSEMPDGTKATAQQTAECIRLICCGGETSDSTPMWSDSGAWKNPDDSIYWPNDPPGPRLGQQLSFRTNNKVYGYPNIQHKLCYRDLDDPPDRIVADFSPPGLWEAVRRRAPHTLVERPDEKTILDMKSLTDSLNIISLDAIEMKAAEAIANLYSDIPGVKTNYDRLMNREATRYTMKPQDFITALFNGTQPTRGTPNSVTQMQNYLNRQLSIINEQASAQIKKSMRNFDGIGISSWKPMNVDKNVHDPYRAITDEINILGVHISSPLFSGTPEDQFPGTMIFTSKHKRIHARIVRSLGNQAGENMGCNVFFMARPNIILHNIELDNSDCQEQILNQLGSSGEQGQSDEFLTNADLFQKAFHKLRGYETAAVRFSKPFKDKDPENVMLSNVKITSSVNFRKMFPGRPLIAADSQSQFGAVSVDNLVLTNINDTHMYRDTRDPTFSNPREQPVPLMPLHAVFWGFKGVVNLGHFPDPFDIVLYGNGNNFAAERLREATATISSNCTGFTEKSLYDDFNNSLSDFSAACTSTPTNFSDANCTVTVSQLVPILSKNNTLLSFSDQCILKECDNTQKKRSFFCYQKKFVDTSDVIALDGRDFFDVAADRYACFEAPKLHCTFNYVSNAITIVVGWLVGYIFLRAIFKFADLYSREPCISITSTLEKQLTEAGLAMVASEVGSRTVRVGFENDTSIPLGETTDDDESDIYESDE